MDLLLLTIGDECTGVRAVLARKGHRIVPWQAVSEHEPPAVQGCAAAILCLPAQAPESAHLVLRRLRGAPSLRHLPLLVLGRDGASEATELVVAGADDFQAWPCPDDVLETRLQLVVARGARAATPELRAQVERLELVLAGNQDGYWDWDLRSNAVAFSRRWKEMLGHEDHEIADHLDEWTQRVHPDDLAMALTAVKAHIEGRTASYVSEHRLRHKDGTWRWILDRGRVVRDASGQAVRMIGTHTDVTERREAEERFRTLFEQSYDATFVFQDGRIVDCNAAALVALRARDKTVVLGRHPLDFTPELQPDGLRSADRMREYAQRIEREGSLRYEWLHRRLDGEEFLAEVTVRVIRHGSVPAFLVTWRDVTQRKRMEQEILRSKEAAERADRAKSQFLATMSHELRTPLNAVLGMTNLLLETELGAEQREMADVVRMSGESLLAIVNDVLEFANLDAGAVRLEEREFQPLTTVHDALDAQAERAHAKGLRLIADVPEDLPSPLQGDPVRVRQVLATLLGNAVKFTESGEIVVRVRASDDPGGDTVLRVSVIDTGVGIAPEALDTLFHSFTQADGSPTRRHGGTSLGLVIAKRLVQRMGGEIGVESEPGKGSTFWFTVRLARTPLTRSEPPRSHPQLRSRRLLVAGDASNARWIVAAQAASTGAAVDVEEDGSRLVERMRAALAQGRPFDAVLIDHAPRGIDPLALTRALRVEPGMAEVPVLLLSTWHGQLRRGEAERAGVTELLVQPVRPQALREALLRAVGAPAPAGTERVESPAAEGRRFRVLVAEDNLVNQRIVASMVTRLGHRADVVGNGLEAVQALARQPYDLVLMDLSMPEMDGVRAVAEIRSHEGSGAHVPIVALTAHALREDRDRCLAAGMDDHLAKPVRLDDLHRVLERWLPDE